MWTALGLMPLEAWESSHVISKVAHTALFAFFGIVFFFAPVLLFVIGLKYFRLAWPWPTSLVTPEYWAEVRAISVRSGCWLFGAATAGAFIYCVVFAFHAI